MTDKDRIIGDSGNLAGTDWVEIDRMFVAPYGRPTSPSQIGRMSRGGFDPNKLGVIILSLREDGRYAILDGNHRKNMAQDQGWTKMLAQILIDLSYEEEARLFVALNTSAAVSALDKFRARLEYKERDAMSIQFLLSKFGLQVSTGRAHGRKTEGTLTCVRTLDLLLRERGSAEFAEVFGVLRAAWDYDPRAYVGIMIDGMRQFWSRHRSKVDRKRLIEQLQLTTPTIIIGQAGALHAEESAPTLIGKHIQKVYNGRLRGKEKFVGWTSQEPDRMAIHQPNADLRAGRAREQGWAERDADEDEE